MAAPAKDELPSAEELSARREQLDKELQILTQSFAQLKGAQDRFVQNIACLASLKSSSVGQTMLVSLTPNVYVMGQLAEQDRVMVDIGTGYYLEKDVQGADEYYVRKVKYLQEQLNMLGQVLSEKKQAFSVVSQALQVKLQ